MSLRGVPSASPGEVAVTLVADTELAIERVSVRASDNGGGTSGRTLVDVVVDGTSSYPGAATDDQRPSVAFDAVGEDLVHNEGIPEVRMLLYGSLVSVETVELPVGGGVPSELELQLVCWA